MIFPYCRVTGVKADIANGEIKLTFSAVLNDENMENAERLGLYASKDAGKIELRIIPQQPGLPTLNGIEPTVKPTTPEDWQAEHENDSATT
jgi:hypothetical protein